MDHNTKIKNGAEMTSPLEGDTNPIIFDPTYGGVPITKTPVIKRKPGRPPNVNKKTTNGEAPKEERICLDDESTEILFPVQKMQAVPKKMQGTTPKQYSCKKDSPKKVCLITSIENDACSNGSKEDLMFPDERDENTFTLDELNKLIELQEKEIASLRKWDALLSETSVRIINEKEECYQEENELLQHFATNKPSRHRSANDVTFFAKDSWVYLYGAPYFKDKNYFQAPPNQDVHLKKARNEINLIDISQARRWRAQDKTILEKAVKKQEIEKLLVKNKTDELTLLENLKHCSEKDKITLQGKLDDIKATADNVSSRSLADLVGNKWVEYDWMRISVTDFKNQHTPEECRGMWFGYIHPAIVRSPWTHQEDMRLKEVALSFKCQDWQRIAEKLATGRTAYQCMCQYQMRLNENLKRGKWTDDEDRLLKQVVARYRVGSHIPWSKVAIHIPDRTKVQIFNRWKYSIAPHIKKGRFTSGEDQMIITALQRYGKNFKQIARFLPDRTPVQIRDRYNSNLQYLDRKEPYKWTQEKDLKLLEMVEQFGDKSWSHIAKEFVGHTRSHVRQRWLTISKFQQNNPDIKDRMPTARLTFPKQPVLKNVKALEKTRNLVNLGRSNTVLSDEALIEVRDELGLVVRKRPGRKPGQKKTLIPAEEGFIDFYRVAYQQPPGRKKGIYNREGLLNEAECIKQFLEFFGAVLHIPTDDSVISADVWNEGYHNKNILEILRDGDIYNSSMLIKLETRRKLKLSQEKRRLNLLRHKIKEKRAMLTTTNENDDDNMDIDLENSSIQDSKPSQIVSQTNIYNDLDTILGISLPKKKCTFWLADHVKNSGINIATGSTTIVPSTSSQSATTRNKKASEIKFVESTPDDNVNVTQGKPTHSSVILKQNVCPKQAVPSVSSSASKGETFSSSSGLDASSNDFENLRQKVRKRNKSQSHIVWSSQSRDVALCLPPNQTSLIGCRTLLLCRRGLSKDIENYRSPQKEDTTHNESPLLDNSSDSSDMDHEGDTKRYQGKDQGRQNFEEASALFKKRFTSLFLIPAIMSNRKPQFTDYFSNNDETMDTFTDLILDDADEDDDSESEEDKEEINHKYEGLKQYKKKTRPYLKRSDKAYVVDSENTSIDFNKQDCMKDVSLKKLKEKQEETHKKTLYALRPRKKPSNLTDS
uniref:snRNA-activating protein complex subunit 4 n=1 Tax=Timema genevievae TaxID=629358 RepID=A0A7R9PJ83_TIMGE|nr:unnamed protein product [Timema genevievae]